MSWLVKQLSGPCCLAPGCPCTLPLDGNQLWHPSRDLSSCSSCALSFRGVGERSPSMREAGGAIRKHQDEIQCRCSSPSKRGVPTAESPARHEYYISTSSSSQAPSEKDCVSFALPPECRGVRYTVVTQSVLSTEEPAQREFFFVTWELRTTPTYLLVTRTF